MAYYIRQETLTFSITWSGGRMKFAWNYQTTDYNSSMIDDCAITGGAGGYGFEVKSLDPADSGDTKAYMQLIIGRGSGVTYPFVLTQTEYFSGNNLTDIYDQVTDGSWTCSVDAYLMWDAYNPSDSSDNPIWMPQYTSPASEVDPPIYTKGRIYYILKEGGMATMTLTAGGNSCTYEETIASSDEIALGMSLSATAANRYQAYSNSGSNFGHYDGLSQSIGLSATCNGAALSAPGYSYSTSGGSVTGAPSVTISAATAGGAHHEGGVNLTGSPARSYVLNLAVSALHTPYPATIGMKVDLDANLLAQSQDMEGGSGSISHAQHQYNCQGSLDGIDDPNPANVDEFASVRCWLRPGSSGRQSFLRRPL